MAPYAIKKLLLQVLQDDDSRFVRKCCVHVCLSVCWSVGLSVCLYSVVPTTSRSPLSKRQLNGALNRVPRDFYGRGESTTALLA